MSGAELIPLIAALAFYAAAMPLYHGRWPLRGDKATRWAARLVIAGLICHGAAILVRGIAIGSWPVMELRETLVLAGWIMPALYLLALGRQSAGLGFLAMPVAISAAVAGIVMPPTELLDEYAQGDLLRVHIAIAILAYAAFALSFCCAVAYVIQETLLKRKRIFGLSQRLPSLGVAEGLGYKLAALGFLLWTLMIASGILYSARTIGEMWSWTPKQIWSLATWALYAAFLHARMLRDYRGRRTMLLLILGFVCAGATWLLSGQLGDRFHP